MSTKSTIHFTDDNWHLYAEAFDSWNTYLEFPIEFLEKIEYGEVVIRVPTRVWKQIREHAGKGETYIHMTPEERRAWAEEHVADRIRRYHEADARSKDLYAFFGSGTFGDIEAPAEEQVAAGIAYITPPWEKEAQGG